MAVKSKKQELVVDSKNDKNPNRLTTRPFRALDVNEGIMDVLRQRAVESYQTDMQGGKTEYNAVVLRTNELNTSAELGTPVIVRARVPELHSHLPLPRSQKDARIIDLYPEYIAENPDPNVQGSAIGSVIRVNHLDTYQTSLRYENGRILEVLNRSEPFAAGFNSLSWTCEGEDASSNVVPGKGEPIKGSNKSKKASPRKVNGSSDAPTLQGPNPDAWVSPETLVSKEKRKQSNCAPQELLEALEARGDFVAFSRGKKLGNVKVKFIEGKPSTRTPSLAFGPKKNMFPIVTETHNGIPFAQYFERMQSDAREAGVELQPTSIFRSMPQQKQLWNANPDPEKVARPGRSNHQTGIAIDFSTGAGSNKAYHWLTQHAVKYGFVRTVVGETWHWEYRPPMARGGIFKKVPATRNQGEPQYNGSNGGWPSYVGNPTDETRKTFYKEYEKLGSARPTPADVKKIRT
jgi:hypothetical protein